jgi:pyroglutamyl-peptidase
MKHPRVPPLLVTGFEPFGGETVNPSALVARALHGRHIGGAAVIGVELPCAFGVALALAFALRETSDLRQTGGTLA